MSSHLTAFYLPVSQRAVEEFLVRGTVPDPLVERIGIFAVVMASGSDEMPRADLARAVSDLYGQFRGSPEEEVRTFLGTLHQEMAERAATNVLAVLSARGIRFASEDQMASGAWRGGDGHYTHEFQSRCRNTLMDYEIRVDQDDPEEDVDAESGHDDEVRTVHARRGILLKGTSDQARAATAIAAAPDEHVAMTAYAGTGKTHLLLALAETGQRYTHLTPKVAHREAFFQRSGWTGHMQSITLGELAKGMAKTLVQRLSTRWVTPPQIRETTWTIERQIALVGLPSIAGKPAASVLSNIHRIIDIRCRSTDPEITITHVPRLSVARLADDGAAYVAWSQKVWEVMSALMPAREERAFTFTDRHLVKWLDVNGAEIPPLGTLVVDEAHDLPAPWYALLDRYPQGWVAMGDPYQCLVGRAPKAPLAKALTMAQSVRTGQETTPLFEAVIDRLSERLVDDPIVGSRDHVTRHHPYDSRDELPHMGLRVYGNVWKLLEEALRLKNGNARFRFVPASERALVDAARAAILLRRSGDRPKSYALRAFKTWHELSQHIERIGHPNVVRLFDRGFSESHLEALTTYQGEEGRAGLLIGLLDHCKNLESSVVAISDCCFPPPLALRSNVEKDTRIKAIYVAMTRVKDELWIPGDALDRLSD